MPKKKLPFAARLADTIFSPLAEEIDLFDQRQLETVLEVCRRTTRFPKPDVSCLPFHGKKANPNDADRLRKYLARFGLSWETSARYMNPHLNLFE
jgi:transcriptional regulatory protein RtcR